MLISFLVINFIILLLHGTYLAKTCKGNYCIDCRKWHCDKFHEVGRIYHEYKKAEK